MAIITISRGSYSKGKEVAEKVAQRLGYRCLAREVILNASKEFNIPEVKFARAVHDGPSVFDRFTYGKERYMTYFQMAFLKAVQPDNVVYHGLAGHFFVKGISHVLKVRILADMDDRIRLKMEREGVTREEALAVFKRDDEERRQWSRHLYGIDTWDPQLYDLVIRIRKLSVDDAVEMICHCASLPTFQTTFESQKALGDMLLAAKVKAALISLKPDIQVMAQDGRVLIGVKATLIQDAEFAKEIERVASAIDGVKAVEIKLSHLVDWSD